MNSLKSKQARIQEAPPHPERKAEGPGTLWGKAGPVSEISGHEPPNLPSAFSLVAQSSAAFGWHPDVSPGKGQYH